jgi:hypothetical protein
MRKRDVFINCPFSKDYQPLFQAIVFTTLRSGFVPRCALEVDDGSDNRFDKICRIIGECKLGVHDISKTELDPKSRLPRFNMPLELGLFLAAKKFGGSNQSRKKCLIFDREPYRYQKYMSDISGQDIHAHFSSPVDLIAELAAWLRAETKDPKVPGGRAINKEFKNFEKELPLLLKAIKLAKAELTFLDYRKLAENWITGNQP